MRSTIICVDDDKFLFSTLSDQLIEWVGQNYTVEKATGGGEGLEIFDECMASGTPVSVIISDYIMPIMRGDEFLCKIHERDKSVRNIMLTGYSQLEGIVNAINKAGLYRFVSKPWDKKDLMLTVIGAIKSYEQEKANKHLLQSFEKLYRGYEAKLDYIIGAVARSIDLRGERAAGHSLHVAELAQKIGQRAGLKVDDIKPLRMMAAFHDIGRLILHDADLQAIQKNDGDLYNSKALAALQNEAAKKIFSTNLKLDFNIQSGICYHTEKYDGTGLRALKGRDIPIDARIIAVANAYELLLESGVTREGALEKLAALRGSVFDPEILDMLNAVVKE